MGRHAVRGPALLAVHAHPDDETLWTGGLLATFAVAGAPVTLVTCTRGERGEVIAALAPGVRALEGDGPALAAHRVGERAAALEALGVDNAVFLDEVALPAPDAAIVPGRDAAEASRSGPRYADSGMAWVGAGLAGVGDEVAGDAFVRADLDEAVARLVKVLAEHRPDVVVTYEPGGGYGHPDHVRTHEVTMRAVDRWVGEGNPAPVVLWAAVGAAALRASRAALGAQDAAWRATDPHLRAPEASRPLPPSARDEDELSLAVDVAAVLDRVLGALRAHATQVQAVHPEDEPGPLLARYALSDGVVGALAPVETYVLAPGSAPVTAVDWPDGVFVRLAPGSPWVDGSDAR